MLYSVHKTLVSTMPRRWPAAGVLTDTNKSSPQDSFATEHAPTKEEPQPPSSRFTLSGSKSKIVPTSSMNLRSVDVDVGDYDDVYDDIKILVDMEEDHGHEFMIDHVLPQPPPFEKSFFPWITARRVPVRNSAPSCHAPLIKFNGGVKAGLFGRISRSPSSEWHAFGIISDNKQEHMMLVGAVGDFTRTLVSKPPKQLWVRQVHFAGLPYLVNMYDRVLVVATGSAFGRPNVYEMSVDAAKKWGAEVVIVTSNPEGSRDILDACKASGIPAFGPILGLLKFLNLLTM
ncbi:hypothetical protein POM88_024868 [Heracleum sosnowskyi]|uniref:Uncharacterized protein n=1 Tax=Heracleum sosnowskyi TaxID=360622 RepID=A0AAD8MMM4_9APIA|nr:hypothetical protein POM88_024868 [Heracleum sosnowskyi]